MAGHAGMARLLLALFGLLVTAVYGSAEGSEEGRRAHAPMGAATGAAASATRIEASPSTEPTASPKQAVAHSHAAEERAVLVDHRAAFAHVSGVALVHPAERIERVGFHQASDARSLNMTPARTAVGYKMLPSRHRPTSRHTAADIVVHPQSEILAPVSGIVKRAGPYLLYCKTPDAFVVISPEGHPELEIKVLHISGLRVRPGDRVVAGKSLLAKRPTKLPFGSQVDAFTAAPAWPHVHMEATRLEVPSATPVAGPSSLAFSQCG